MPSTFPGNLVILGSGGKEFVERIEEVSGGTINIQFFEPGALVPALEIFDAVSTGAVDAGWSTPGYWAGKIPALQFFTAIPFGPLPGEVMAWLRYGGGNELFIELYAGHNIHPVHCMMISPEGSGWFRNPIESVDDLQGLKMRFFGLGAKVMEKVGVSTQLLAGGDIYPALDLGTIDATEFAQPVIDFDLGFYQVAKHYYLPGWHQPTSFSEFIVNMDQWQTLSVAQQAQVETTCAESILKSYGLAESLQPDALVQFEERGVTVHQWEPEFLAVFENAWNEVVEEEAAKDADFARVWTSLSEFREKYKTWGDRGYLP
ncbi:MAG: TRAP transporter substrate-binding protein [Rhodospirillales bacterium]|nr:TRAP transporter substrate-binding protein [Rhodospirillales bacterium]MYE19953.1 TRAP transporter substrate-binding protein [Rhodospirillales bacterium]